jgi:hypothetical protein
MIRIWFPRSHHGEGNAGTAQSADDTDGQAAPAQTEAEPGGPILIAQRALANPSAIGIETLATALQTIVEDELWREALSAAGIPFESFGHFAIAKVPHGLGVRSAAAARLTRHALFEKKLFAAWTDLLELIARKPGRSPNIVNDEDLKRYYKVSTATTSRDRLLPLLRHDHPEAYRKIVEEGYSPYAAAVEAGVVVAARKASLRFGVCDLEAAARLKSSAQSLLLRELFRKMSLDAQCAFIAHEIEPHLGADLAGKWRRQKI